MTKDFKIPKLDKESWKKIQILLTDIGHIISDLSSSEKDGSKRKKLDEVSINLGMLDMYLGRHYTLRELTKELNNALKNKEKEKNND